MNSGEIIAELPHLSRLELEQVDQRLHELLQARGGSGIGSWNDALQELVGTAQGLPSDLAENHDHYLHGGPQR